MFRITEDPSSGSSIQCLAKITVIVSVDMDYIMSMSTHTIEPLL